MQAQHHLLPVARTSNWNCIKLNFNILPKTTNNKTKRNENKPRRRSANGRKPNPNPCAFVLSLWAPVLSCFEFKFRAEILIIKAISVSVAIRVCVRVCQLKSLCIFNLQINTRHVCRPTITIIATATATASSSASDTHRQCASGYSERHGRRSMWHHPTQLLTDRRWLTAGLRE